MKFWSLLIWVTQFGFSVVFPLCGSLLLASWLRQTYHLGPWVTVALGIFGVLVSISTLRSCLRALRKEADKAGNQDPLPKAYNEHD